MIESFKRIAEKNMEERFKQLPWEQRSLEYMIRSIPAVLGTSITILILYALIHLIPF